MGRTGSGSCPFVGFDMNLVEPLGSVATLLDMRSPFFFSVRYMLHMYGDVLDTKWLERIFLNSY